MKPTNTTPCRACGEPIVFLRTSSGKQMPVNPETVSPGDTEFEAAAGHVSHFSSCSGADDMRRSRR